MEQYISKSAVKAELERIEHETNYEPFTDEVLGKRFVCRSLLSFLNTLEVKENDLVEELDYDDYLTFFKEHPEYNNGDWGFEETWTFGQYCYKLGLKAQKSATNE